MSGCGFHSSDDRRLLMNDGAVWQIASAPKRCDSCDKELRTGMPDGREFEWVHLDGTRYCHLLPGDRADEMTKATWHGTTGQAYA